MSEGNKDGLNKDNASLPQHNHSSEFHLTSGEIRQIKINKVEGIVTIGIG